MRVTTKGQVTIPLRIRTKLGIKPGADVDFIEKERRVEFVKVSDDDYMARIDRVRGTLKGVSTDELMRMTRGET